MIVTQALKRCNERTAEARFATNFRSHRSSLVILVALCSFASVSRSADTQAHNITAGEAAKVQGVIESRDGNKIQLRENPSTVVVLITDSKTHITMRSGLWGMSRKDMDSGELLPGLYVSAEGRGGEHGELMTSKIFFDPSDLKAARSADSRVRPVEGRAGALEARAGTIEGREDQVESRAGDLEKRSTNLEGKEQQTEQQVAVVKDTANQANDSAQKANTGVASLGDRVTSLDDYSTKTSVTVLFAVNSSRLTPEAKTDLGTIVQQIGDEKGYMIEVAGFADSTGNVERNQVLSEARAAAVVRYLQEEGNVPLRRILAPAGLGTTHAAAENTTAQGRKQNRRVEVRILVNRGLNAGAQATQPGAGTSTSTLGKGSDVAGAKAQ
jgi:outer membrane protein OmpA-like peptidoglycan-associated protein